jgi:hypothetical protein
MSRSDSPRGASLSRSTATALGREMAMTLSGGRPPALQRASRTTRPRLVNGPLRDAG